jgi:membrane-bound metal-dependent hydrolase YbcI (DUF457 family)
LLIFVKYLGFSYWFFIVGLLFSILPDIDLYKSKLGKKIPVISIPLNLIGHRGIMHSFTIPFILSVLFFYIDINAAMGIFIGYSSHLFLDMLNYKGLKPFWPLPWKIKGFCKSGGIVDWVIFVLSFFFLIQQVFLPVFSTYF